MAACEKWWPCTFHFYSHSTTIFSVQKLPWCAVLSKQHCLLFKTVWQEWKGWPCTFQPHLSFHSTAIFSVPKICTVQPLKKICFSKLAGGSKWGDLALSSLISHSHRVQPWRKIWNELRMFFFLCCHNNEEKWFTFSNAISCLGVFGCLCKHNGTSLKPLQST